MKKQIITSGFVVIMLMATITGIASTNNTAMPADEANDVVDILETAISNPDDVSLDDLVAVEKVVQDLKMEKIQSQPWIPGQNAYCLFLELFISALNTAYEQYSGLYYSDLGQSVLKCEENPEDCEQIEALLAQLLAYISDMNDVFEEKGCNDPSNNQEAQSASSSESASAESSSCPCSAETTQQASQEPFTQDLIR